MKLLNIALVTSLALTATLAVAGPGQRVQPSKIALSPAAVERVIPVLEQEISGSPVAIRLVQSDNGGSSDITSYTHPSSLSLGIFVQGEMFDVSLNYKIDDGIIGISKVTPRLESVIVEYTYRTEQNGYKVEKAKAEIYFADALEAALHADETNADKIDEAVLVRPML